MEHKEPGYKPKNNERISGRFKLVEGEGQLLWIYFYDQETMTKLFQRVGFENVQYIQPSDWDIDDEISCTMNQSEKETFREYVFVNDNIEMCAFVMKKS